MATSGIEHKFRFSKYGEDILVLSDQGNYKWDVLYRDELIDSFKYDRKELKRGRKLTLPDGSDLVLRFIKRGNIKFWEPSINGKIAYNTLKGQHAYIWGSWTIFAFLIPVVFMAQHYTTEGAEEVFPYVIGISFLNLAFAYLVVICWRPVAWLYAISVIIGLLLEWFIWLENESGLPPIMETIGVIIFRDVLVNARWIASVAGQLKAYKKSRSVSAMSPDEEQPKIKPSYPLLLLHIFQTFGYWAAIGGIFIYNIYFFDVELYIKVISVIFAANGILLGIVNKGILAKYYWATVLYNLGVLVLSIADPGHNNVFFWVIVLGLVIVMPFIGLALKQTSKI